MIKVTLYQRDLISAPIELPYQDGFNLNNVYNEQLSSGVITIPNIEYQLPIRRLDFIKITETDTNDDIIYNQVFCVGSFTTDYVFNNGTKILYTYIINLVSPTILLQDKVLPNLSITQPLFEDKRNIYAEIDRIIRVFFPQLTISTRLKNLTINEICPELQWNRKTLFEILNDLLSTVSATVNVLVNINSSVDYTLTLDYISFIPNDVQLNNENIVEMHSEETLDDYCNEIEMEASNVVSKDFNTFAMRNITPRSQEFVLTTDNCQLILDRPIYKIKKIEVFVPATIGLNIEVTAEAPDFATTKHVDITPKYFDITKWVVEDSVYNSKKVFDNIGGRVWWYYKTPRADETYSKDYKSSFLSYTLGNNTIDNLTYANADLFGFKEDFSIRNIVYYAIYDYLEKTEPRFLGIDLNSWSKEKFPDPRKLLFNVDYQSLGDVRFRLKKNTNEQLNNKLIIDGQANSYVDADALLKGEQENVNRLGNRTLTINAIFDTLEDVPNYGIKYNNYVLSQAQMRVFNEKIYWQGVFTENFVRKNLYTGIRSKARFTSIATGSEALTRKDLIQIEMLFNTENRQNLMELGTMLLNHLGVNDEAFQIIIRTRQVNEGISEYILAPTSRYALGKNIILGFKAQDNFSFNSRVDSKSKTDAYTLSQVPYVDINGEFESIDIIFARIPNFVNETNMEQWIEWSRMYPIISVERFNTIQEKTTTNFLVKKDNREIYSADIQLTFKSINKDIIVYDNFIVDMPLILGKERIPNNIQQFYQNDDIIYTADDKKIKGNYELLIDASFIDENEITKPVGSTKTWGLCDASGNLLIVCNANKNIFLYGGRQKLC